MKIKNKIFIFMLVILFCLQTCTLAVQPSITAKGAILVETSTGRILYEKSSTRQMYPASTTKIMTAILVIENCDLSDIVTVSETALSNIPTGYVTCDIQVGEEISVKDLLYALMVKSANDAAYVLAEHVAGTIDNFSSMMNAKAKEIGCKETNFVNPNGIHSQRHYSSAYDLYLMAQYGMKNETFRNLVSTTSYTLPATNKHSEADRSFTTTNELINPDSGDNFYSNAIGIKTGFTSQAGNCLVAESSRDGLDFIAVVLNAEDSKSRYTDCKTLFDYAYDNFTLTKIKEKNTLIDTIEIENGTKETKNLDLLIDETITVINNKSIDMNQIIPEINLNENLTAPISSGDIVGSIKYKVDDIEYSANILAGSDVIPQTDFSIFILISGILLLLIAISILGKKKTKKRKKRK